MINQNLLLAEKPVRIKIAQIKEGHAKLVFSDNQSVEISQKYLPKGSQVGDELYLNLLTEEQLDITKKEIARQLLEDILSEN